MRVVEFDAYSEVIVVELHWSELAEITARCASGTTVSDSLVTALHEMDARMGEKSRS